MKEKNKILWKRIKQQKYLLLMVLPGMIWLLVFCYLPMYGCQIAFQNYRITDVLGTSDWAGLKWFAKFFQDPSFFSGNEKYTGNQFSEAVVWLYGSHHICIAVKRNQEP